MYTLGINAVYHDSAACLVQDGQVIAAAEEERFAHVKHGKRPLPFSAYQLPYYAIDYCLSEAGIALADVEHVAYSFDPHLLLNNFSPNGTNSQPLEPGAHPIPAGWGSAWDPLLLSSIVNAPRHLSGGVPHDIRKRFHGLAADGPYRWHFVEHHTAHAASAFFVSPFERAAVLTLDGHGERAATTYSLGDGISLERLGQVDMPHSLGLLYERLTAYLGFQPSSSEAKVMALASFGKPRYMDVFHDIVQCFPNGWYTINDIDLENSLGPRRRKGEPLEERHFDIANSLQRVLQETVLQISHWLHKKTQSENLCLAGSLALNCAMNAHLRDRGPFNNVWVQPAAGDAGTALGAALWVDIQERERPTRPAPMDHAFFGPGYDDAAIETFLRWSKLRYRRVDNPSQEAAEMLAGGKILGWYQGRLEFGPRALGARSMLASPIPADMQERLNDLKEREQFRPMAPVVLEEEAAEWFSGAGQSPFMLFVYNVAPDKAHRIPAVRHVDGTARIQTINRDQHALYYDLLKAFHARTGVPVLVNTSFNIRGEPIVCTPRDAVECFWTSPLDALVIGSFVLEK